MMTTTYTLAEVRDGTGFAPGARFELIIAKPTAEYVPAYMSDDEEQFPAVLRCPVCGSTDFHEVDSAVRWTEVEYGATDDPAILHVYYGDDGDYESDHLRCSTGHELDYPANWREILSEN